MNKQILITALLLISTSLVLAQCPSNRIIKKEAVSIWESTYCQLSTTGIIPEKDCKKKLIFNYESVMNLFHQEVPVVTASEVNYSCRVITFWLYLDENGPQFALSNENDESLFLTVDGMKTKEEMQTKFNAWKNLAQQPSTYLVYVKKYRYSWEKVLEMLKDNSNLVLGKLAHTVSPEDPNFDPPKESSTNGVPYEGFFAIDFSLKSENANAYDSYDFAMPCPKNCPE